MFICITHNPSGETLLLRRMAPNETLNLRHYVEKWADSIGMKIADADGYIPRGCAEYFAEIRDTKHETGSCWESLDFYIEKSA